MGTHMGHVFTLANSIIGVSLLAMPFCFRQCGIVLSILMLLLSSQISRLACHFLMKSAITERIKNFEMLAFRAFGPTGKLIVEMSIIGFMLGTCVAFFVVIGDLGPNILGPIMGLEHPSALRPSVLIGTAIFVVLPLGLLRNVDSLNGICAASLAFYGVLVLKVFLESTSSLFDSRVWNEVDFWKPSGLLRCIPIFSMALSCQTQLFEVFGSLPTTPLDRANTVVKSAVNLTTFFYIAVGSFGYIAYANTVLTGNVMMNFSAGASSEIIKICFLMSVAVSFPLVIFPCRASIYSFLYSKIQHSYEGFGSSHIPETQFQCITLVIVTSSLVIGLMIPNIEIVLGLVGSTLGVFVCVITPGLIFTTLSFKKNNERLVAQIIVGAGIVIMVLGTYANLYATEETFTTPLVEKIRPPEPLKKQEKIELRRTVPNINKDVAQMEKVLKQLKLEEKLQRKDKQPEKEGGVLNEELKGDGFKAVSPELISDHNPQPVKSDEGPKPQPVAPEPPDDLPKKIPMNLPESLQHLEVEPKIVDNDKAELPVAQAVGAPEVIKNAVEKVVSSKNAVEPVQPEPPVGANSKDVSKDAVPPESKHKIVPPLSDSHGGKISSLEKASEHGKNPLKTDDVPVDSKAIVKTQNNEEVASKLSSAQKEVPGKQPVISEIEQAAKTPGKGNLSISMAQGVPLPLAIKGLEKKLKQKDEPKKVGREILQKSADTPEQREKRDIESFAKEENADTGRKSRDSIPNDKTVSVPPVVESLNAVIEAKLLKTDGIVLQGKSKEQAALSDDKPQAQPVSEKLESTNSLPSKEEPAPIVHQDIPGAEKPGNSDDSPCKEPCQKNLLESEPRELKYVMEKSLETGDVEKEEECPKTTAKTKEAPTVSLIKSPQKLTNEDTILPENADFPHLKERVAIVDNRIGKQKK